MKAVVDTNVVAYFLLGTPQFADESRAFLEGTSELLAPALWEAELANTVWMVVRTGVLPARESLGMLTLAIRLGVRTTETRALWGAAFLRSLESGLSIYDTLFVELASRMRLPLATFDRKILKAYPEIARRPEAIAS